MSLLPSKFGLSASSRKSSLINKMHTYMLPGASLLSVCCGTVTPISIFHPGACENADSQALSQTNSVRLGIVTRPLGDPGSQDGCWVWAAFCEMSTAEVTCKCSGVQMAVS